MARRSRSNIGCRRFRKTSRSVSSSTLPSCDGGSNATIRNSSRRSGWDILKDGNGAASTTLLGVHNLVKKVTVGQEPYEPLRVTRQGAGGAMPSSEYFRRQADICLRLSLVASDEVVSTLLIAMAQDYVAQAEALSQSDLVAVVATDA